MRDHEGQDHYDPGELFVYANGDRLELGMVKRPAEDGSGYFCWYSRGDTAALTPVSRMHKLANAGFTHVEKLLESAENAKADNAKLRELASGMYGLLDAYDRIMGNHDACETPRPLIFGDDRSFRDVMRECGIREGE